ncbi:MAG: hypothetical protein ABIJ53_07700 [Verrucomicrobiota bacterium]
MSCSRIVIAATGSGVGKTSIAIALIRSMGRLCEHYKLPDN